jgi:hypothetical protein
MVFKKGIRSQNTNKKSFYGVGRMPTRQPARCRRYKLYELNELNELTIPGSTSRT